MGIEFDSIEAVIDDIRQGKLVIVADDENRENEGDLICAAEKVTPEIINFMITHARGLVCAPITQKRAEELGIMRPPSTDHQKTAFTESVDAATCTTGISAFERAMTVHALINPECKASDFTSPGHLFPIAAKPGGVLERAGHTETAVDLARLAGLYPAGTICEITREDGHMARLPDLVEFRKKFGLKLTTVAMLIEYRKKHQI